MSSFFSLGAALSIFVGLKTAYKINTITSIDSNKVKTLKLINMPSEPPNCVSKLMNVVWGDSVIWVYRRIEYETVYFVGVKKL